jgi:hypothetical protein
MNSSVPLRASFALFAFKSFCRHRGNPWNAETRRGSAKDREESPFIGPGPVVL